LHSILNEVWRNKEISVFRNRVKGVARKIIW
jgi:hypothetical protein